MWKGLFRAGYPKGDANCRWKKRINEGKQEEGTEEDMRLRNSRMQSLIHFTFLAEKMRDENPSVMKCRVLHQLKNSSTYLSPLGDCDKVINVLTSSGHL